MSNLLAVLITRIPAAEASDRRQIGIASVERGCSFNAEFGEAVEPCCCAGDARMSSGSRRDGFANAGPAGARQPAAAKKRVFTARPATNVLVLR